MVLGCLVVPSIDACGSKDDLSIGSFPTLTAGGAMAIVPSGGAGGVSGSAPMSAGTSGSAEGGEGGAPSLPGAAGAAGEAPVCTANDVAPAGSLLHRYSFSGTGLTATDSVGTQNGTIEPGATLDGNGLLVLDGSSGYVDLPNKLISVLTDVTLVTWAKFLGGAGYERIFDFGVGVGENDTSGQGVSYVAVAPYGGTSRLLMLARKDAASPEVQIPSDADINDQQEHQVALVFASMSRAELYLDGKLLGRTAITFSLSDIVDVNDWLGRSQWVNDHYFNGSIDEFRIYGQALTPCAIQALDAAGPDAP